MYVASADTNVSLYFLLQDAVTGAPYTTTGGEASFNLLYTRAGAVQVSNNVTAALGSAVAAHEDNKVFHCGNGVWRCDFPDAAFAAGADRAICQVTHDSGSFLAAHLSVELSLIADVFGENVDSTGTEVITAKKALEAVLAVIAGDSAFTESTGGYQFKGRDGSTDIVTVTVDDVGDRSSSTVN